jgi:hypothetical protein
MYSRKAKVQQKTASSSAPDTPPTSISPAAAAFLSMVTAPILSAMVAPPRIAARRGRQAVSLPPRRSRRVAKLPPEHDFRALESVCKNLGLTDDQGRISDKVKDINTHFFSKPLSVEHVAALATLLGKVLPSVLPVNP